VGRLKAMVVDAVAERPGRLASIDPAVAALLDHIAEALASEYVRLMEDAAEGDDADFAHRQERQEA